MFQEGISMRNTIRHSLFGLLIAVGLALAPSAFARGHVSVGIGLPGVSLGYSDCRHCGGGRYYGGVGYYGGGYYSGYAAPVYYSPAYYEPAYYSYPSYGGVYYDSYYSGGGYRGRHHDGYYGGHRGRDDHRGRDNGHRASYYDRSGYRH
jgi:hypothetical protein